ncbi:hypothetical protein BANRA_04964 [Klebsiella variicola]|nr:hypothetical protein BANRA_04964 [Klebsiella variicola]
MIKIYIETYFQNKKKKKLNIFLRSLSGREFTYHQQG